MEEKKDHKIYKYTNKVNGKVYIGRTCNSLKRRAHADGSGYKSCTYFWNAIQKYGWENFEGEVLEERLTDKEAAKREIFYIHEYDSIDFTKGYNLLDSDYKTYSDAVRKKVSEHSKGKVVSEETRKKLSNAKKGKKLSEETRKRMSIARRGRKLSEEARKKLSDAKKGKKLSEDHKKKLSKVKKGKYKGKNSPAWGRVVSEEVRKRLSKINKGKKLSGEICKKMSLSHKGQIPWNKGKKLTACQKVNLGKNSKGKNSPISRSIVCVETGIKYYSITYASECTGIGMKNISFALNKGGNRTAGGFHWRYVLSSENFKIGRKIMCVETGIEYYSIKEAAEQLNLSKGGISEALRRGQCSGGYHWKYVEPQALVEDEE